MVQRPVILVVDDEPNMCRSLKLDPGIDLVITDLSMPDVDGMEILRRAKQLSDDIQVVMMTAYSTVESAVEAMKLGAFEYLIKPFSTDEVC